MQKHPGFKAVARSVARKQHISIQRASAIIASGARKASSAAIRKNPRLTKVRGVFL